MTIFRGYGLPLAVLLGVALGFGLITGLRAVPPTETEIITTAAEAYVAETGGMRTDCYARPSPITGVRLVVICAAEGRVWVQAYDPYGRAVVVDQDDLSGPAT